MKKILFPLVTSVLALGAGLAAVEGALRLWGIEPWPTGVPSNEPTMHEADPVLGWVNKEGHYAFPGYVKDAPEIVMTFRNDHSRVTSSEPVRAGAELVVVGCSCTQGWGISDDETYPWRLQQRFPALEVRNYGTGGYGTWQSYLMLQRVLPACKKPVLVLYGFIDHHQIRNAAAADWLERLASLSSRGHIDCPYATIGEDGSLIAHPPERFVTFPLPQRLALTVGMQRLYMKSMTRGRAEHGREVTERVMLEMDRFSREHGAKFVVALLLANEEARAHYLEFLRQNGIEAIDCVHALKPDLQVPGNPHPNGKMNVLWADEMSERIEELLDPDLR